MFKFSRWLFVFCSFVFGFFFIIFVKLKNMYSGNSSNDDGAYITECIKFQKIIYSSAKMRGVVPENGCEVFVRHIPFLATELELLEFFQTVGPVYKIRLMMNEDGKTNRGFAYVTYFQSSDAKKAVIALNEMPYKKDYHLLVEHSLNNCRLFIGGIPTYKRKDEVWQELCSQGVKNIVDVIMYRSYSNRAENRGFVFVEFKTHEEAAYFRAKFGKKLKLWNISVVVDWSIPVPQVDECIMNQVKIIYLRNLDVCETREQVQATVLQFTSKSTIEKVYKFKNYAFIHVVTREYAEHLLQCLQSYYKERDPLVEVKWAQPSSKYTTQDYRHQKVIMLSSSKGGNRHIRRHRQDRTLHTSLPPERVTITSNPIQTSTSSVPHQPYKISENTVLTGSSTSFSTSGLVSTDIEILYWKKRLSPVSFNNIDISTVMDNVCIDDLDLTISPEPLDISNIFESRQSLFLPSTSQSSEFTALSVCPDLLENRNISEDDLAVVPRNIGINSIHDLLDTYSSEGSE